MENLNFLPVKDAATLLGVTPQYVRKLIREQTIPGQKVGNVWLVEKSSVQQLQQMSQTENLLRCLSFQEQWG